MQKSNNEKIIYEHLILLTLMKFGGFELEESKQMLNQSEILDVGYESRLFHDEPYYWGMTIKFGLNNTAWYTDPKYWPIPEDYLQLERDYHSGKTIFSAPCN